MLRSYCFTVFWTSPGHPGLVDMEPDQRATVLALLWLGRGDYDITEWSAALEEAMGSLAPSTADQIIAIPLVADYLQEGLSLHGYSCD